MRILRSTKSKITKDENGENMSHLEITEVVSTHFNIANNSYQHDSRVLYRFVCNKSFGQLLDMSSMNFVFFKKVNSEFQCTEVLFNDQILNC